MPMEVVIIAASSDISPNMFSVDDIELFGDF